MRILHTEALKRWGGEQNRVLTEAVGLARRGHEVTIAAQPGSEILRRAGEAGVPAVAVPLWRGSYHLSVPVLMREIARRRVEIVVTHSSSDSWAGGLAARLSRPRPALVRVRHNMFAVSRGPLSALLYRRLPDAVVTLTEATRRELLSRNGLQPERVVVIPSGVDPGRFRPDEEARVRVRAEFGVEGPLVVNVSDFDPAKGLEHYLSAAQRIARTLPEARFLLVGRGSRERVAEVRSRVAEGGLEGRFFVAGFRSDVPAILAAADCFLFTSVCEGLGTAVLEAMAAGLPVVCFDLPTLAEVVVDGVTGLLAPLGDAGALAERVVALLREEERRRAMGEAGRRRVAERFSVEAMLDRTEALYRRLLEARG